MNIGIIGLGVVGSAVKNGLEKIGHTVYVFDTKFADSSLADVLQTDVCFLSLPTPPREDGSCDISVVEGTLRDLEASEYQGLAVIKSTVEPGTTDRLSKELKISLAFCPEFLRERAAYTDFAENHDVLVIGTYTDAHHDLIKDAHGSLPKNVFRMSPLEAELAKYFSNVYNALRITFANEFYDVCRALGADYGKIKHAMVHRQNIEDAYLDCNENFRGFGGVCLPKDTKALAALVRKLGLDLKLFETIVEENAKFKRTVLKGMRDS
jgi:UDPglucose 6-dehydrogenase